MFALGRTPLAWKNLTHDPRRLAVAVSGVTFAVVLMFVELGFQSALFNSTVALVKNFDADIVITSASRYSLSASSRFPASTLALTRSCEGVADAQPVYLETYMAGLRKTNFPSRPIRAVGFDVRAELLTAELQQAVDRHRDLLAGPQTAIIDVKSKSSIYEPIDPSVAAPDEPLELQLAGKRIQLVGTFELGTDFANDGTLLMSLENFAHYFPFREYPADPLSTADLGLIQCDAGTDVQQVAARVRAAVASPAEASPVAVRTREEFTAAETRFWDENTPIGVIFQAGVFIGLVVGVLICYQVLFNDISDHMPEFATLMAMGYSRTYFVSVVVREALYLAMFGYCVGWAVSWLIFQVIASITGLPMTFSLFEISTILLLTVAMCVLSGLLAVRKLLSADPASLF